ncbi:g1568 [Coccomyxa elongata]
MVHGLSRAEGKNYIVKDTLKGAKRRQLGVAKKLEAATSKGIFSLRYGVFTEQSLHEDVAAVYDALVKGLSLGAKKGEGKKLLMDVCAEPTMDDSFMETMYYEHQPMFIAATASSMEVLHKAALAALHA